LKNHFQDYRAYRQSSATAVLKTYTQKQL